MNRREFLQHTVAGGAMTALGVSMSPSLQCTRGHLADRLLQPAVDDVEF